MALKTNPLHHIIVFLSIKTRNFRNVSIHSSFMSKGSQEVQRGVSDQMFVGAGSLYFKFGLFFSCQSSQQLIWFIPDSSVQTTYLAACTSSSVTPVYILLFIRDKTRSRFSVKSDIVPMANSQELLLREMGPFIVQCPFTPLKAIFLLFSCLMNNYKSIRHRLLHLLCIVVA